jgi:hypothetical protein
MTDDVLRDLESLPGWTELVAAGRVAPPTTAVVERARSAVLTQTRPRVEAPQVAPQPVPARRGRPRVLRPALAAAAAAAIAVVVSLVVDSTAGPPAATAAATERLAGVAASVPGDGLGPGQYRYRVEEEIELMQRAAPTVWRSESWTAADGSTWRRDTYADGQVNRQRFPNYPGPVPLSELPAEPRALLRRLEQAVDGSDWAEEFSVEHALFNALQDLLREYQAPPELRAAMIRALGLLPHVAVQDPAVDARGRTGVGLVWSHEEGMFAYRAVFIIDPATAQVLESRTTYTKVPTVEHTRYALEHRSTLVETSVVDELPADMRGIAIA